MKREAAQVAGGIVSLTGALLVFCASLTTPTSTPVAAAGVVLLAAAAVVLTAAWWAGRDD